MEVAPEQLVEGRRQIIVTLNADGSLCTDEGLRPLVSVDHALAPGTLPAGINLPPQGWQETVSLPAEIVAALAAIDHSAVAAKARLAAASNLNGQRVIPAAGVAVEAPLLAGVTVTVTE